MKRQHLTIRRCRCNARFTRLSQAGVWYWCLYCDAHISGCAAKGSPDACVCQRIAA